MAKFATLYSFTDQGIRAVKESPSRLRAAIEACAPASHGRAPLSIGRTFKLRRIFFRGIVQTR